MKVITEATLLKKTFRRLLSIYSELIGLEEICFSDP